MKISASNQIKGTIIQIDEGAVNGRVTIDIGNDNKIFALITMDSIARLGLKTGSAACAVIKASDVMVAVE
jgi:molybdopterin-binding protein